jgi:enoyl-CoA hydratase
MSVLHFDRRPDGVAVLTFDSPNSRANILTRGLWDEFDAALRMLPPDLPGLVLASAKPDIFIAGADLKFFAGVSAPQDHGVREIIELGLSVLERLESLPFPTCAAIDGAALGGGLEVALACDFRVCGTNPKAELGVPEVKLGLIPGWGGTQRLPRIVGPEVAAEMLRTGDSLTAEAAREAGLVSAVVESESLLDFAARHVLLDGWQGLRDTKHAPIPPAERERYKAPVPSAPNAVREAMLVLTRGGELPLDEGLKLESEAFLRLAGSDESKALIAAFFVARKKG